MNALKAPKGRVQLDLTAAELRALWLAANVYAQEVDEQIHGGSHIEAFRRAKAKLEKALT